jgi:protein O-mannosyl-transferase
MKASRNKKNASPAKSGARRRTSDRPSAAGSPQATRWAICIALAVVTLALYIQVSSHDFLRFDDEDYITKNAHVQAGLTWQTVRWSLTAREEANWHPLTWLSHALDCQLFGLHAGGHHMTSVLIHVLNTVLLFALLQRATGSTGCSFFVAALFAWHPINVESVAWVGERKNVLSTFFLLLALWAYGRYAKKPSWAGYMLVGAFFALGLATKPMLVTLPFALLLLDYWPLQRVQSWLPPSAVFPAPQFPFRHLCLEKVPLLLVSAASSVITVIAQRGTITSTENLSLVLRVANALYSCVMYVWQMFWPFGFAIYYPHPFVPSLNREPEAGRYLLVALGGLLVVGVIWMAWQQRVKRPYVAVGWLWFLGTMFPVIGIVQVGMQGRADRYAYVPLIGLFVIVAWGAASLAERLGISLAFCRAAAAVVLVALWLLTYQQIGYWRNGYEIWTHTLEVTRDNFVADDNMADTLMTMGRPESLRYFQDAARISPRDGVSHGAIAAYLEDQGELQEAIKEYEVVMQNPPSARFLAFAYANLGIIYTELGDRARSDSNFQKALTTDLLAVDEMINNLTQNVNAHPADEGYLRLGLLLEQTGKYSEARAACEEAVKLKPGRLDALTCLDRVKTARE